MRVHFILYIIVYYTEKPFFGYKTNPMFYIVSTIRRTAHLKNIYTYINIY